MKPLIFNHEGHTVVTTAWTVVSHGPAEVVVSFQWVGVGHRAVMIAMSTFLDLLVDQATIIDLRPHQS